MDSNSHRRAVRSYKCAICDKTFPSPEAGSAHLDKRHGGHGYLSWYQPLPQPRKRLQERSDAPGYRPTQKLVILEMVRQMRAQIQRSPVLSHAPFSDEAWGVIEEALSSETAPTFTPRDDMRGAVARTIADTPLIASLLYDIDLLPEQIKDERRYNYMLAVIDHMRQALKNAAPQAPCNPAPEYARPEQSDSTNSDPRDAGLAKGVQIAQPAESASLKEKL